MNEMIQNKESFINFLKEAEAIIFDLDGTLIELNMPWKIIKDHFKTRHREKYGENLPSNRFHANFNYIREKYGEMALKYYTNYLEESEMENIMENRPKSLELLTSGIEKIKKFIPETSILGICSSNYHKTIEKLLELHNLLNDFTFIFGRDDVIEAKPSPEGLKTILKKFSLNSEKVLFIGDSWVDEEAAREAAIPYQHVDNVNIYLSS